MAFCPNCGAQVNGAFCPNCGTSMGNGGTAGSGAPAGGTYPAQPAATASGLQPHVAAMLCYTPFIIGLIASIIFLVAAPYNQNKFVRFNAFQSLFLHLALFILGIVLGIVTGVIAAVLHIVAIIMLPLYPIIWLGVLVLFLFMMYKSFNNQKVNLPFIGDLADKQA